MKRFAPLFLLAALLLTGLRANAEEPTKSDGITRAEITLPQSAFTAEQAEYELRSMGIDARCEMALGMSGTIVCRQADRILSSNAAVKAPRR